MGIDSVEALLTHYPFRYEVVEETPLSSWEKDGKVTLEGVIVNRARVVRYAPKRSVTRFQIVCQNKLFEVSLFNRPWISAFQVGKTITLMGKYEGGNRITAASYNFQPLHEQEGIKPVYALKEGITQNDLARYVKKAFQVLPHQENRIPDELIAHYRLISRDQALHEVHAPTSSAMLKQAFRHLKYEEFFLFQLVMQGLRKNNHAHGDKPRKQFEQDEVWELTRALPFALTKDQKTCIQDILDDLQSSASMYRMVQGDVGSGKTMVAAFAMYACVLAHKQAAFMAPTEILAKQHAENLKRLFQDYEVEVEVLYSALKGKEKQRILERLVHHEIDIIVGTHALFQEDVYFYDLGLVIADEQHRFGVEQRKKLLQKGDKVDFLLMSATPIPRTLAMSLFGDMDVSTIEVLPQGRKAIITKVVKENSMRSILEEVLAHLDQGDQCYIVCPAIEKNEDYAMRNASDLYEALKESIGRVYQIGLLHGKMSSAQKDEVMQAFQQGDYQILVSTTVIEVGVDVKNANLMVIYDANRFGLSQIHQLRGRVGRGDRQGYCWLLSDSKDVDAQARLQILEETCNGFEIARRDLALRGPGDILGTRQSGVPGFILGDIIADSNILEVARKDAGIVLKQMETGAYPALKRYLDTHLREAQCFD